MDEKEMKYIDTDLALIHGINKQISNQMYGMKFNLRNSKYNPNMQPLIHAVIADIYCLLVKARRFKDVYKDTVEYKLAQHHRHECYGMIKALLTLELISKDKYILLCKAIDTYDLSIIEEYMYKLSK